MKKFLQLICIVLVFDNILLAQTEKGTWLLGGSAGYVNSNKAGSLIINPTVGYFLVRDVAGGALLNFVALKNTTYFSIGPFVKYYFFGDERGRFYGSGSLNIGGGSASKFDTGFGLGAGYAMFLNESISIDIGANFNKVGSQNKVFFLGAGFQIHFMRFRE